MTDPAIEATTSPAGEPGSGVPGLVQELRGFNLSEVDAYRAAFTALALAAGWSKARIGRYLGISRARVGQKVEKLRDYAVEGGVPILVGLLSRADGHARLSAYQGDAAIEFEASAWDDLEFARRMCDIPG